MSTILIEPLQLRTNAQTLRQKSKTISSALDGVEKLMSELSLLSFAGNRASAVRSRFTQIHGELIGASALLVKFAQELEVSADVFEKADKIFGQGPTTSITAPKPATNIGPLPISNPTKTATVSPTNLAGIATKVKAGVANTTELGYPRNGYNGVQSDCTWYAAQAVLIASGGKVKLSNLGSAANWVTNAKKAGYVVDNTPQAGSVVQFSFGHVGFIENVQVKNGRTLVTWSEEQAGGGRPTKDWPNVTQVPGQLRWEVTADLTNYFNNGTASCIHVNYS